MRAKETPREETERRREEEEAPQFFFDEFFADETDPGIPVTVTSHGKAVVLYMKRTLSLEDSQRAFNKAARFRINPSTGQKELEDYDEQEATIQTIYQSIKSWPFTHRDGRPVLLSPANVRRLDAVVVGQLKEHLERLYEGRKVALDPFANPSVAAS